MEVEGFDDYLVLMVAKRIAGDIAFSGEPGKALRKWREFFGASQHEVARFMGVSASVISDYEKGRRMPGARFIQRFVKTLLLIDQSRGWLGVRRLAGALGAPPGVIIDMRDFDEPQTLPSIVEAVEGVVLTGEFPTEKLVYGYTVIDSIRAITSLSGIQFYALLGGMPERAIVFTGVTTGRSPMVAIRVSPVKPSVAIIHGPRGRVDRLALELARLERIPLILSLSRSVERLVSRLRSLAGRPASGPP